MSCSYRSRHKLALLVAGLLTQFTSPGTGHCREIVGEALIPEQRMSPSELDKLAEKVADLVCERLANPALLITKTDLMKRTSLSRATIDRAVARGEIPFVKRGRRILFSPEAVVAALTGNDQVLSSSTARTQ